MNQLKTQKLRDNKTGPQILKECYVVVKQNEYVAVEDIF